VLHVSPWARLAFVLVTAFHLSCGSPPTAPQRGSDVDRATRSAASNASMEAGAQNLPPNFVLRTTPPADPSGGPFPTISGEAPLAVRFNLCRSDDPDPEDSLNYQFSFGDSGRPAFNPDGTFAPDFDHFCRVEHVYERPGTYTATVSVTDKHLEDQGQQVVAFARRTQSLTIVVVPAGLTQPQPHPSPSSSRPRPRRRGSSSPSWPTTGTCPSRRTPRSRGRDRGSSGSTPTAPLTPPPRTPARSTPASWLLARLAAPSRRRQERSPTTARSIPRWSRRSSSDPRQNPGKPQVATRTLRARGRTSV